MTEREWLTSTDPAAMLRWRLDYQRQHLQHGVYLPAVSDRKLRLFAEDVECVWQWRRVQTFDGKQYTYTVPPGGAAHATECVRVHNLADDRFWIAAMLREVFGNPFRPVTLPVRQKCADGATCPQHGCHWLTPTVVSLAQAAYQERGGRCPGGCRVLHGPRKEANVYVLYEHAGPDSAWVVCPTCHGTGRTGDGHLDRGRLAVLSDALEEAGCPDGEQCGLCEGDGKVRPWRYPQSFHVVGACEGCHGTGRVPHPLLAHLRSPGPHVRGCWAVDLVLGK